MLKLKLNKVTFNRQFQLRNKDNKNEILRHVSGNKAHCFQSSVFVLDFLRERGVANLYCLLLYVWFEQKVRVPVAMLSTDNMYNIRTGSA